jgi:hypothetical protein
VSFIGFVDIKNILLELIGFLGQYGKRHDHFGALPAA